jgi:putative membrane protein
MHKSLTARYIVRWLVSSLGLYISAALLGSERIRVNDKWWTVLIAGLLLAAANMAVKPILIFLSFPAIILTLGLFMLVINGLVILFASWLYDPFYVKNLGVAIVVGIIIGLVNYLVTRILEDI